MNIDSCISELLYKHDCVIVPGLGGFVAQYRPASVHPALHVISPPSKKIAFNAFLQMNDGLLANHLSGKVNLNFNEANRLIQDFTGDVYRIMEDGRKVKIEQVGTLHFDPEKNIQFTPDQQANFLIESFGLAPVHAPVIRREGQLTQEYIPQAAPRPGTHRRTRWKIIEVIPAAAVVAFLLISPPAFDRLNEHLSTLLPFSRMIEYIDQWKGNPELPAVKVSKPVLPTRNIFDIPPANPAKAARLAPLENDTDKPSVQPTQTPSGVQEQPATAPSKDAPARTADSKAYHVIGGCFRTSRHAGKFASEMQSRGLDARVIGRNNAGLLMVSLFNSDDRMEAGNALNEIRQQQVSGAWLHHTR